MNNRNAEKELQCPKCRSRFTPVRIERMVTLETTGKIVLVKDMLVRCVECKSVYYRPLLEKHNEYNEKTTQSVV